MPAFFCAGASAKSDTHPQEVRCARVQAQHLLPAQQRIRQNGLPEAAGRAEKENPAVRHKAVELLPDRGLYNDGFRHSGSPSAAARNLSAGICLRVREHAL